MNTTATVRPDAERVEAIAAQLLAGWFNAYCVTPEQEPKLIESTKAVDKAVEFALTLCQRIDALDLPPARSARLFNLLEPRIADLLASLPKPSDQVMPFPVSPVESSGPTP